MTLGLMSTGAAGKAEDLLPWRGIAGRDEFFWITEVNKATLLTNTAKGLLTKKDAARVYKITDDCYHKEVIGWFKQNAFVAFYED